MEIEQQMLRKMEKDLLIKCQEEYKLNEEHIEVENDIKKIKTEFQKYNKRSSQKIQKAVSDNFKAQHA